MTVRQRQTATLDPLTTEGDFVIGANAALPHGGSIFITSDSSTAVASAAAAALSASHALTSEGNAAAAATAALNSAVAAQDNLNSFLDAYYGARATDPTTRPSGSAIQVGDVYYRTTAPVGLRVWTGSSWDQAVFSGSGFMPVLGGNFTGKISTVAPGAGGAGFRLIPGAAGVDASSPADGDLWYRLQSSTLAASLSARINGVTERIALASEMLTQRFDTRAAAIAGFVHAIVHRIEIMGYGAHWDGGRHYLIEVGGATAFTITTNGGTRFWEPAVDQFLPFEAFGDPASSDHSAMLKTWGNFVEYKGGHIIGGASGLRDYNVWTTYAAFQANMVLFDWSSTNSGNTIHMRGRKLINSYVPVQTTFSGTIGTNTITVASTAGISVGDYVTPDNNYLSGISGARVTNISGTTLTLDMTQAATSAPGTIIYFNMQDGASIAYLRGSKGHTFHNLEGQAAFHGNDRTGGVRWFWFIDDANDVTLFDPKFTNGTSGFSWVVSTINPPTKTTILPTYRTKIYNYVATGVTYSLNPNGGDVRDSFIEAQTKGHKRALIGGNWQNVHWKVWVQNSASDPEVLDSFVISPACGPYRDQNQGGICRGKITIISEGSTKWGGSIFSFSNYTQPGYVFPCSTDLEVEFQVSGYNPGAIGSNSNDPTGLAGPGTFAHIYNVGQIPANGHDVRMKFSGFIKGNANPFGMSVRAWTTDLDPYLTAVDTSVVSNSGRDVVVASAAGVTPGMYALLTTFGTTGIPPYCKVAAVSGTTVTLEVPTVGTIAGGSAIRFYHYGNQLVNTTVTASTSNTITVASTTGITVGLYVRGTNIPLDTTVTNISGNVLTLSRNTTGSAVGAVNFQSLENYDRVKSLFTFDLDMPDTVAPIMIGVDNNKRYQGRLVAPNALLNQINVQGSFGYTADRLAFYRLHTLNASSTAGPVYVHPVFLSIIGSYGNTWAGSNFAGGQFLLDGTPVADLYADANGPSFRSTISQPVSLSSGGVTASWSSSAGWKPSTNGTLDLGAAFNRWHSTYSVILDVSSNSYFGGPLSVTTSGNGAYVETTGVSQVAATYVGSHASYAASLVNYNTNRASGAGAFVFLQCYSNLSASPDRKFVVQDDGNVYCDGAFTGGGADIAEWTEYHPDFAPSTVKEKEKFVGVPMILVEGDYMRPATEDDDKDDPELWGVISRTAHSVGNSAELGYHSKYLQDDFGRDIMETYEVISWKEEVKFFTVENEQPVLVKKVVERVYEKGKLPKGVKAPRGAVRLKQTRNKPNPKFNSSIVYIPRSQRPEWDIFAYSGRLRVKRGSPVPNHWLFLKRQGKADIYWAK